MWGVFHYVDDWGRYMADVMPATPDGSVLYGHTIGSQCHCGPAYDDDVGNMFIHHDHLQDWVDLQLDQHVD